MNEKKIRIKFNSPAGQVWSDESPEVADKFKELISKFLRDPDAVVFETRINGLPCLLPKGFINNCYITYEEIKPNNLGQIASMM